MAKAAARCTCSQCGEDFGIEKKCYNRTDADEWVAYAERTYNLCGKASEDRLGFFGKQVDKVATFKATLATERSSKMLRFVA